MTSIHDLELSVRAERVLVENGVQSLEEMRKLDRNTVLSWPGAGTKVWKEISSTVSYMFPSEERLRRELEYRLLEVAGQMNHLLDQHPDYGVRVVDDRLQILRKVN